MARSLKGPWLTPREDTFDGRAFYAAKSASDGQRRFLFGWNPTRTDSKDDGSWNWGGCLVVHEVYQTQNGSLAVRVPESVNKSFGHPVSFDGTIHAPGSYAWKLAGVMPEICKIQASISFEEGTRACGLLLHAGEDGEAAYYIRLEPLGNRFVFDCWPRPG